jgi:ATP-dependent protease ClpP protease subunit
MTLRKLPSFSVEPPKDGIRFDIHPSAKAHWDDKVTFAKADEGDNVISILDPIGFDPWTGSGVTAKRIQGALRQIGERPVNVLINSPGGDFFEGLAIYNLLREHPEAVNVQILGMAASAASTIAMSGDTIQIAKAGMLFIHNTQWVAVGDRHVMQDAADQMTEFDLIGAQVYSDRTGGDLKDIQKLMDKETFISGEKAVDQGFADELLPADAATKPKQGLDTPPAYRLEHLLEKYGIPRAERRKAVKEFVENMPSAVLDEAVTPGADETVGDGLAHLQAAAMRLRLR